MFPGDQGGTTCPQKFEFQFEFLIGKKYIRMDKSTESQQSQESTDSKNIKVISKFEDAKLSESLLRGIYGYGWEKPSYIQQKGIPAILTGRDLIMQAQSGTGKTGTFTIGTLQTIDPSVPEIQGVIILPTRELASQVYGVISQLATAMDVNFIKCIGKSRVRDNLTFPKRATVLVGTPGKLEAVLSRRIIKSQPVNFRIVVIDEFDKMLEDDFIPTIMEIFKFVGDSTQVVLSSATVNKNVMQLTEKFMRNPIEITIKEEAVTLEGIRQFYIDCERSDFKFDVVLDLFNDLVVSQCVIFVNSKSQCDRLEEKFNQNNFAVRGIHGGLEQEERNQIMDEFRSGKVRVLISTDLTARGIDVQQVSLVINYELPNDYAQYIHRIGRTGRYGKKGVAINLIGSQFEGKIMQGIEKYYSTAIQELPENYPELIN